MSEKIFMKVSKPVRIIGWVFLSLAAFCAWYSVASNYDYSAVSGTYICRMNGEMTTLVLKEDQSFQEEAVRQGKVLHAQGSWYRYGESGIGFSMEFIKIPGEEIHVDGSAYGYIYKRFGLFFSITLAPDQNGPKLYKKLIR
jgi:hypothetical protein